MNASDFIIGSKNCCSLQLQLLPGGRVIVVHIYTGRLWQPARLASMAVQCVFMSSVYCCITLEHFNTQFRQKGIFQLNFFINVFMNTLKKYSWLCPNQHYFSAYVYSYSYSLELDVFVLVFEYIIFVFTLFLLCIPWVHTVYLLASESHRWRSRKGGTINRGLFIVSKKVIFSGARPDLPLREPSSTKQVM